MAHYSDTNNTTSPGDYLEPNPTIYDATYWFCEKFLDSRSRTVDEMVKAVRFVRQNIAKDPIFSFF